MKKLLLIIIMMIFIPISYANEEAKIKIRVSGPIHNNRYFLCIPDIGCLSIYASQKGKVFKILNGAEMNTIFITDVTNRRLYNQGLPHSCDVKLNTNQTITINGVLAISQNKVSLNNLHCTITSS